MRALSRLVSIIIVLAVVAGAVLLIRAKLPEQTVGKNFHVWAGFRDGSRLAVTSKVVIAGVRVGEVTKLTVEDGLARVDILLDPERSGRIPVDSWLTKRAESAFGDSYLEIIPGDASASIPDGGQITHVMEGGSTDTVLRAISRALPKIDRGLDAAHDFMLSGRTFMEGTLRDRTAAFDRWLAEGSLAGPIANADKAMESFDDGTARAAERVASAKPDIAHGLDRADDAIARARAQIKDLKGSLHDGLQNARDGMDRVDEPLDNAAELLAAIDRGSGDDWKGTLGRLVNDPELADDIEETTAGISEGVAGTDRFRSWIGMRIELNVFAFAPRVYVTAELNAHKDKFYLLELSRDPLGSLPDTDLSDNPNSSSYTRTVSISDHTRFTAQFGKRFGPLALRAGVKDSTVGAGLDVSLHHNDIRLSADVFGGFSDKPRVKLTGAYAVFRSLYVLAGVDDALTTPGYLNIRADGSPVPHNFDSVRFGRDYFVGAALHFDDADLATLLRIYGSLLLAGSL